MILQHDVSQADIDDLYTDDHEKQLESVVKIRKKLSVPIPPYEEVMKFNIHKRLIELLFIRTENIFLFESCWILINLASGSFITKILKFSTVLHFLFSKGTLT
jgi:hypothetical protein